MSTKNILVDFKTGKNTISELTALGYNVITTQKHSSLYESVCGHSDMTLFRSSGGVFVCAPEMYDYYKDVLSGKLIKGKKTVGGQYPDDIPYNVADVGGYLIHNTRFTDPEILNLYSSDKIIYVRQGYAKCSICAAGTAVITSDSGICKALANTADIDVLKIREGYIRLDGINNGFIGGATGFVDGTVFVNGNLSRHPDGDMITAFLKNHGIDVISLTNGDIVDIGTIIPLF